MKGGAPREQTALAEMGARLRQLRLASGLTQADAAARAALSRASMANVERGAQDLRISALLELADLYGVSVGVLVGTEPMPTVHVVRIRQVHVVSCEQCGDFGVFDELANATEARRGHSSASSLDGRSFPKRVGSGDEP